MTSFLTENVQTSMAVQSFRFLSFEFLPDSVLMANVSLIQVNVLFVKQIRVGYHVLGDVSAGTIHGAFVPHLFRVSNLSQSMLPLLLLPMTQSFLSSVRFLPNGLRERELNWYFLN